MSRKKGINDREARARNPILPVGKIRPVQHRGVCKINPENDPENDPSHAGPEPELQVVGNHQGSRPAVTAMGAVIATACLAGYVGYKIGRATMRAAVRVAELKLRDK